MTDIVRLSLDISREQHTFLKMMAAKENISLKSLVINRLYNSFSSEDVKCSNSDMQQIFDEFDQTFSSLSKR